MGATKVVKMDPENPDQGLLKEAAEEVRRGGLVVMPTETVYGIAASMLQKETLERLYEIKQRPKDKPFSLHIAKKESIEDYSKMLPPVAYKLMDKFWPGPLTLIVRAKEEGGIGVRLPDNEIVRRVILMAGVPVVCPSSNISGRPAPVTCEEALRDLNGLVDFAIDAGKTRLGMESSIVDLTHDLLRVVREGAILSRDIEAAVRKKIILFVCTGNTCRSVMAEGLMKNVLQEKNRDDVEVFSAGTMMFEGMRAAEAAQEVLRREGIDVSSHRSRRLSREMLLKADMIVVMTMQHEEYVLGLAPQVKNRLFLLREFAKINTGNLDLIDPIGRPVDSYEEVFAVIKETVQKIASII